MKHERRLGLAALSPSTNSVNGAEDGPDFPPSIKSPRTENHLDQGPHGPGISAWTTSSKSPPDQILRPHHPRAVPRSSSSSVRINAETFLTNCKDGYQQRVAEFPELQPKREEEQPVRTSIRLVPSKSAFADIEEALMDERPRPRNRRNLRCERLEARLAEKLLEELLVRNLHRRPELHIPKKTPVPMNPGIRMHPCDAGYPGRNPSCIPVPPTILMK